MSGCEPSMAIQNTVIPEAAAHLIRIQNGLEESLRHRLNRGPDGQQ